MQISIHLFGEICKITLLSCKNEAHCVSLDLNNRQRCIWDQGHLSAIRQRQSDSLRLDFNCL